MNMEMCIRCGKCHDVCPQEAVRHDSERIPQNVEQNIDKTKELLKHFETRDERKAFLGRMIKHFNKERKIADKSIEKINGLIEAENG